MKLLTPLLLLACSLPQDALTLTYDDWGSPEVYYAQEELGEPLSDFAEDLEEVTSIELSVVMSSDCEPRKAYCVWHDPGMGEPYELGQYRDALWVVVRDTEQVPGALLEYLGVMVTEAEGREVCGMLGC